MVLKLGPAVESPGRLGKAQMAGLHLQRFRLPYGLGATWDLAFLASSQGMLCRWPRGYPLRTAALGKDLEGAGGLRRFFFLLLPFRSFHCLSLNEELYFFINEGDFCHESATGWKNQRR